MKSLKAPSAKTVIHLFPWPAWLTHPSHPFPFHPLHPTHWHIPSSVLPTASKTPTSDTHLSRSGNTEGLQTIFTLCKNPSKIKNLFFPRVFINTLANMHHERVVGGLCKGCCPSPSFDWQVRAAVHASDGFTWGVCAQRGRWRATYTRVCFSLFHCCNSPWFPLSVSSLGRHPSTGAFSHSVLAAGCEAEMRAVWVTKWRVVFFLLNSFSSKEPKENLLSCFMCTLSLGVFFLNCIIACWCVLSQWQKAIERSCVPNCKLLVYYLQALNGPKIECGRWTHDILSQHRINDVEETMSQTSQLTK